MWAWVGVWGGISFGLADCARSPSGCTDPRCWGFATRRGGLSPPDGAIRGRVQISVADVWGRYTTGIIGSRSAATRRVLSDLGLAFRGAVLPGHGSRSLMLGQGNRETSAAVFELREYHRKSVEAETLSESVPSHFRLA